MPKRIKQKATKGEIAHVMRTLGARGGKIGGKRVRVTHNGQAFLTELVDVLGGSAPAQGGTRGKRTWRRANSQTPTWAGTPRPITRCSSPPRTCRRIGRQVPLSLPDGGV